MNILILYTKFVWVVLSLFSIINGILIISDGNNTGYIPFIGGIILLILFKEVPKWDTLKETFKKNQ